MELRNRIGISTLSLRGMSLDQAINAALKAGFHVLELVPHLYGGPENVNRNMRSSIRKKLDCFETVTVHTSVAKLQDGRRANISSSDKSYRHESVCHYLEHIKLALEIGAKLATFHIGAWDEKSSHEDMRKTQLLFAQSALELAKDSDIKMGYEWFEAELTKEIGSSQFGILFDIGHAALQSEGDLNKGIIQLMDYMLSDIVQFHSHGVHVSDSGNKQDHQPLQLSNGVDYTKILSFMEKQKSLAPIIFEIQNSDADENLENTIHAREKLIKFWEDSN